MNTRKELAKEITNLFKHQQQNGHKINYDEVEILYSADSNKSCF